MSLKSKIMGRFAVALGLAAALLFLPAGTLKFWEAWVFLAIVFIPMSIFTGYFLKHDPQLVERRLQFREKVKEQKVVMKLANLIFLLGFLVTGFDHRFGWTLGLGWTLPLWLKIAAQGLVLGGYLLSMWVMDVNRYASRTIQVEPGQKVISDGPYRWIRHPMYFSGVIMTLPMPVALGSYVALPFFALFVPILVARLLNEEKVLRQELPGYDAYCQKTRFRLLPYVW